MKSSVTGVGGGGHVVPAEMKTKTRLIAVWWLSQLGNGKAEHADKMTEEREERENAGRGAKKHASSSSAAAGASGYQACDAASWY